MRTCTLILAAGAAVLALAGCGSPASPRSPASRLRPAAAQPRIITGTGTTITTGRRLWLPLV